MASVSVLSGLDKVLVLAATLLATTLPRSDTTSSSDIKRLFIIAVWGPLTTMLRCYPVITTG